MLHGHAFFHLRRLRSLRRQLGRDVTARLVSALVLSRLDYCNAILVGLPQTTLSSLQRVLHAAARMVLNLRPCDHVTRLTPALLELHWLPIAERIDFKLCLLVHKALVGDAPQYIADLIRPVADLPSRASCGQHIVAICMCHEHVEGSEIERLPSRPHACGIVYLLTSKFTGRRQHLSNAVLKLFYLTGASLNICK